MGNFESFGDFDWEDVPERIALHIVHAGRGALETGAGTFELHADSIFVIWPGQRAHYFDHSGFPWKYSWFAVEGKEAPAVLKQCGLMPQMPVAPAPAGFSDYAYDLLARVERARDIPFYAVWTAWDCLRRLAEPASPFSPDPAAACKMLIDSNPSHVPSVDGLAAQLDVNRSTLFRCFRKAYGISPKQYIEQRRFKKACVLLWETHQSMKEIAANCGFDDPCYLSRAFQKRFGQSPLVWRKAHTGGAGESE